MSKRIARGVRNRNPLNIRVGQDWQGEVPEAQRNGEKAFEVFETTAHGFRAGAVILRGYQKKHGLKTIKAMISRWAPPNENDTLKYIALVSSRVGVTPEQQVDFNDYHVAFAMLKAMAFVECGVEFDDADINKGLEMAGIAIANRPLAKTRTVKGAQVAAAGATVSLVAEVVKQAEPAFPLLSQMLTVAPYLVTALVLIGVAVVVYARWEDRREGLR